MVSRSSLTMRSWLAGLLLPFSSVPWPHVLTMRSPCSRAVATDLVEVFLSGRSAAAASPHLDRGVADPGRVPAELVQREDGRPEDRERDGLLDLHGASLMRCAALVA